ncbi:putative NACHT domain-containing protein [Seiridium cardinale]
MAPRENSLCTEVIKTLSSSRFDGKSSHISWNRRENLNSKDLDELVQLAVPNLEKYRTSQWKTAIWLRSRLRKIDKTYRPAGEVTIQHDPSVSAAVWGIVKFIIQIIFEYEDASIHAGRGVEEIRQLVSRWAIEEQTFQSAPRVQAQLSRLYQNSFEFLLSANCQLVRGRMSRILRAAFTSACDDLRQMYDLVENAEKKLKDEVQSEHRSMDLHRHRLLDILSGAADGFNPIPAATAGTCEWIYTQSDARQYFEPMSPGFVKIQGTLGSGKSVLARSMVLKLQEKALVLSFHFRPNLECAAATLSEFAFSSLKQIISNPRTLRNEGFTEQVDQLFSYLAGRNHSLSCDMDILLQTLRRLLASQPEPFVIIIDGIDECRDKDNTGSISQFARHISAIVDLRRGCVVMFCRSGYSSNHLFTSDTTIRMDESVFKNDIDRYVNDELGQSKFPRRIHPSRRSRMADACTEEMLHNRLAEFPKQVFAAFDQMLGENYCRLSDHKKDVCQNILKIVLAATKALLVSELASLEGLVIERAERLILELCSPLIEIREGRVVFCHPSVKEYLLSERLSDNIELDSLQLSEAEASSHLARRQLELLDDLQYSSASRIGRLIRFNIGEPVDSSTASDPDTSAEDPGITYDFAAKSWFKSIARVPDPGIKLLNLVNKFLLDPQFVYWAEYIKRETTIDSGSSKPRPETLENGVIIQAHTELGVWIEQLPPQLRMLVDFDQYCTTAYQHVSKMFAAEDTDKELEWLALRQLSNYLFAIAKGSLTYEIRQQVREGLVNLLGSEHPLALKARLDAAYICFAVNEMRMALNLYTELYESHCRRLGSDNINALECLGHIGHSQYFLDRFPAAELSLKASVDGLKDILEDKHLLILSTQWLQALTFDADRQVDLAFGIFSSIFSYRTKIRGDEDLFAVMVQFSLGDIYRRRGERSLAEENLKHAYEVRSKTFEKTNYVVVDAALNLVVFYWHFGLVKEGAALANAIVLDDNIPSRYQRYCQLSHLVALLSIDGNQVEKGIHILQKLAIESERSHYNSALFWAILDLATLLRARGKEKEASSLFDNIVTNIQDDTDLPDERSFTGGNEPDPPRYLEAAENAVKLVREGRRRDADQLLTRQGLRWLRHEDLWLWQGAPLPNTQLLRGPIPGGTENRQRMS